MKTNNILLIIVLSLLSVMASAQLNETFSGGTIAANNPWAGDMDYFEINALGQLQFMSPEGEAGEAVLSVPLRIGAQTTWEMEVLLDFHSTTANNLRIYVYTFGSLVFYIQAGNNNRQISLYSQEADKSPSLRISGRKGLLDEPYGVVSIRLTLEDGKHWSLYTRKAGESAYCMEGEYNPKKGLEGLDEAQTFALHYRYIKGRVSSYYIDNIRVVTEAVAEPETPDEPQTPQTPDDEPNVPDEPDVPQTPDDEPNVPDEPDVPQTPDDEPNVPDEPDVPQTPDDEPNVPDEPDVPQTPDDEPNVPDEPDVPQTPDDEPNVPDEPDVPQTPDDNEPNVPDEPDVPQTPDDNEPNVPDEPDVPQTPDDNEPTNIPDEPNNVPDVPQTPDDEPIDEPDVPQTPDDEPNNVPDVPQTPDDEPDVPNVPDEPTEIIAPVEEGEVIFNELLPDPFAGGASEYIELYNRSGRPLSVSGLVVAKRKADGTLETHYPLSAVASQMEADGYVVLTKDKKGVLSYYNILSPEVIYELKVPILTNTMATLVLFRKSDGEVIDEVSYSSKWHNPFIKEPRGVALERINPDAPTQDPANWTSATMAAGYGTPGYKNSQFSAGHDVENNDVDVDDNNDVEDNDNGDNNDVDDNSDVEDNNDNESSTSISSPVLMEDGYYYITYELERGGYMCRAHVYNLPGRRVASFVDHKWLGASGQLLWDGKALNGSRLPTGIYILVIELYHAGGETKGYKKVFLVK